MRSFLSCLIVFTLSFSSASTTWGWQYRMSSPFEGVQVRPGAMRVDMAGNAIVAGTIDLGGLADEDRQFVVKISPEGIESWRHRLEVFSRLATMELDPSGNVYLLGARIDGSRYIMKLDASGDLVWGSRPVPGGGGTAPDDLGGSAILVGNGAVIVGAGDNDDRSSVRSIVRLSADSGREEWRTAVRTNPYQLIMPTSDVVVALADYQITDHSLGSWGSEIRKLSLQSGAELWVHPLYQDFSATMVTDSVGDIIVASMDLHGGLSNIPVAVEKIDSVTGFTVWRTSIPSPALYEPPTGLTTAANGDVLVSVIQSNGESDHTEYSRLIKLSGGSGSIVSDSTTQPNRAAQKLEWTSNGRLIASGDTGSGGGEIVWTGGINDDFTGVTWERLFGGPTSDAAGELVGVSSAPSSTLRLAARPFSAKPLDCVDCVGAELLVASLSELDGADVSQDCGNGVIDPGEQCDDGNDEAYDECPSHSSSECRFSGNLNFVRASGAKPARDVKSCQLEWYVVNPLNPLDRYDLARATQACEEGDPWCDYDATDGTCGFRVVACLNNQDPALPACTPRGVSSLELLTPRFKPSRPESEAEASRTALADSMDQLLDPAAPELGFTNKVPLAASQKNNCSAPITLNVPLAKIGDSYANGSVTVVAKSRDAGERPKRHKSKIKLVCKPRSE